MNRDTGLVDFLNTLNLRAKHMFDTMRSGSFWQALSDITLPALRSAALLMLVKDVVETIGLN